MTETAPNDAQTAQTANKAAPGRIPTASPDHRYPQERSMMDEPDLPDSEPDSYFLDPDSTGHQQEQDTRDTDGTDSDNSGATSSSTIDTGDNSSSPAAGDQDTIGDYVRAREADPLAVTMRLRRDGRWAGIEPLRDQMMGECRKQGMSKEQAQLWTYGELDRMYPPLVKAPADSTVVESESSAQRSISEDSGSIQGLSDIPQAWPTLPPNASLATEIGWVQANRLRVVEERPGKATLVRLDRAHSPAPSWAALGWLETSIRSYAKYVDVAARATNAGDGEAAVMKRERRSIEEVQRLLEEMMPPDACPECGQAIPR